VNGRDVPLTAGNVGEGSLSVGGVTDPVNGRDVPLTAGDVGDTSVLGKGTLSVGVTDPVN